MSQFGYQSLGFGGGTVAAAAGNTYSLNFDGVDEHVDCGDMTALNSIAAMTISAWIYAKADGGIFINSYTSITTGFFVQTYGGALYFGVGSGYATLAGEGVGGNITLDTWHHLCCVYDAGTSSPYGVVYIDGAAATVSGGALNSTSTTANAGTDIRIGRYNAGGGGYYWNGNIDEVAVWDSALTSAQAVNIYKGETSGGSGGTNGTPGDLSSFSPLGWWKMGDGDTYPTIINHGSTGATNNGTVIDGLEASGFEEEVP